MASWDTRHLHHAYMDRHNGNKITHTKNRIKIYVKTKDIHAFPGSGREPSLGPPCTMWSTHLYSCVPGMHCTYAPVDKAGTSCPGKLRVTSSSITGVSLILQGFRGISCPISEAGSCPVFAQKPLLTDSESSSAFHGYILCLAPQAPLPFPRGESIAVWRTDAEPG